jgi:exopolysaccharide production protein ExoZ
MRGRMGKRQSATPEMMTVWPRRHRASSFAGMAATDPLDDATGLDAAGLDASDSRRASVGAAGEFSGPAAGSIAAPTRPNLVSIDILRGLAAAWVLGFHANVYFNRNAPFDLALFAGVESIVLRWAWIAVDLVLRAGWFGVPLFFVLSGFCVHLPNVHSATLELKTFAIRRLVRIWPPYAAAVALGLAMGIAAHQEPARELLVSAGLHLSFWIWGTEPFAVGREALNPVLWSVVVEVQMYALYAICWRAIHRVGLLRTTIICLLAGLAYHAAHEWAIASGGHVPKVLLPRNFALARFGEWLAGAYAAHQVVQWRLSHGSPPALRSQLSLLLVAGLALAIASGVAPLAAGLSQHALETVMSIGFALAVFAVAIAEHRGLLRVNLPMRLLGTAGQRCYSLYLFHYPMLAITGELAMRLGWIANADKDLLARTPAWLGVTLLGVVAAVVATEFAYRVIERPSHRLARALTRRVPARN